MLDVVVITAVVGTKEVAVRLMVGSLTDQNTSMEEEVSTAAVSSRFEFTFKLPMFLVGNDDDIVISGADDGITDTVTIDVEAREAFDMSSVIEDVEFIDGEAANPLNSDFERVEAFRSIPQLYLYTGEVWKHDHAYERPPCPHSWSSSKLLLPSTNMNDNTRTVCKVPPDITATRAPSSTYTSTLADAVCAANVTFTVTVYDSCVCSE
jgi:hypothetical protein